MSDSEPSNAASVTTRPRPWRHAGIIYVVLLGIYLATSAAGGHLGRQSFAPHFVYLAQSWLQGRLALAAPPPNQEDWARIETLTLKDGVTVRGRFISSTTFRDTTGRTRAIAPETIVERKADWYVSFPPFPAVLFLPLVAMAGLATNDVLFTVILAPLAPALLFVLLASLRRRGYSQLSAREDLALVVLYAIGSVYFYACLSGGVWYTAHVVGSILAVLFVGASLGAERPLIAGLALGCAFATRTPMLFLFPFFFLEAWRCRRRDLVRVVMAFGLPVAAIGTLVAVANWVRFGNPFEFGHSYLTIHWSERINRFGLFNYHFLSRNLAAAFTLLPRFITHPPYIQISRHGLSLFFTTPALLFLLWPARKTPLHRGLWWTVLPVAALSFLYQNDGWIQFGYRFSLDYMVLLVVLLALGEFSLKTVKHHTESKTEPTVPLSTSSLRNRRRVFMVLLMIGVIVNTYGAFTFDQMRGDRFFQGFFPSD